MRTSFLKTAVFCSNILNFIALNVEIYTENTIIKIVSTTLMFIGATVISLASYELHSVSKNIESRNSAIKYSICMFFVTLSVLVLQQIKIDLFLLLILVFYKLSMFIFSVYITYLILKFETFISKKDKKTVNYISKKVFDDWERDSLPKQDNEHENSKTKEFVRKRGK